MFELFKMASACGTSTGLFPSLYDPAKIPGQAKAVNLCGPGNSLEIHTVSDLLVLVVNAVRILMALSGALAIILLIVAGIYYITSAGDAGRVKMAKDMIINVITGLVVVSVAYAAVTFVTAGF